MSVGQFAASVAFGVLSIVLPLAIFVFMVAACVYIARWWIGRKS